MNSKIRTRLWLGVFALITIAGCAGVPSLPEPGTQFRSYELLEQSELTHTALPPEAELSVSENGVISMTAEQFSAHEMFVEIAFAHEEQLKARADMISALEDEVNELVIAGRITEERFGVVHQMAENQAQECRLIRLASYSIAGLSFVFLGLGSL